MYKSQLCLNQATWLLIGYAWFKF